jgi:hypothetical protein
MPFNRLIRRQPGVLPEKTLKLKHKGAGRQARRMGNW